MVCTDFFPHEIAKIRVGLDFFAREIVQVHTGLDFLSSENVQTYTAKAPAQLCQNYTSYR